MQLSEIGKLADQFWLEIPNHFPFVELGNFVVMPNHVHGILIIDNISNSLVETRFIASDNNEKNNSRFIASDNNKNNSRFIASDNKDKMNNSRFIASDNKDKMNNSRFIASDNKDKMNNSQFIASDNNEKNNSRFIASDNKDKMNNSRFIASDNNDKMNNSRFIASDNNDVNNNNNETRLIASLQGENGGFSGDKNPMLNDNISKIIRWYKGRCSFECRKINPNFAWQSRFHDHIIRNSRSFDNIQHYIEQNPLKWDEDRFY
jgi:putative transposase